MARRARVPAIWRDNSRPLLKIGIVLAVLLVFILFIGYISKNSVEERRRLTAEIAQVEQKQDYEERRTQSLREYEAYTQTRAFAEEMASEKLGFVNEGEIIFRARD